MSAPDIKIEFHATNFVMKKKTTQNEAITPTGTPTATITTPTPTISPTTTNNSPFKTSANSFSGFDTSAAVFTPKKQSQAENVTTPTKPTTPLKEINEPSQDDLEKRKLNETANNIKNKLNKKKNDKGKQKKQNDKNKNKNEQQKQKQKQNTKEVSSKVEAVPEQKLTELQKEIIAQPEESNVVKEIVEEAPKETFVEASEIVDTKETKEINEAKETPESKVEPVEPIQAKQTYAQMVLNRNKVEDEKTTKIEEPKRKETQEPGKVLKIERKEKQQNLRVNTGKQSQSQSQQSPTQVSPSIIRANKTPISINSSSSPPTVFSPTSDSNGLLPTPSTPTPQVVQPKRSGIVMFATSPPLSETPVHEDSPDLQIHRLAENSRESLLATRKKFKGQPEEFEYFLRELGKLQTYSNPNEKTNNDSEYVKAVKYFNSLLNKVTSENYVSITTALESIDLFKVYLPEDKTLLFDFCSGLFHKASTEKDNFIVIYSKLYSLLIAKQQRPSEFEQCFSEIIKEKIIKLCRHFEFSELASTTSPNSSLSLSSSSTPHLDEDRIYLEMKAEEDKKLQYKGTFLFLGFLFADNKIPFNFIKDCFEIIFPLNSSKIPSESTLIALYSLLSTISPRITKNQDESSFAENVFSRIRQIFDNIPKRIKFMFEALVESFEKSKKLRETTTHSPTSIMSPAIELLHKNNPSRAFTPLIVPQNIDSQSLIQKIRDIFSSKKKKTKVPDELSAFIEECSSEEQLIGIKFCIQECICSANYKESTDSFIDFVLKAIRDDLVETTQITNSILSVCMVLPYFSKPLKDVLTAIGLIIAKVIFNKIVSYSEIFSGVFMKVCQFEFDETQIAEGLKKEDILAAINQGGLSCSIFGEFLHALLICENKGAKKESKSGSNRGVEIVSKHISDCEIDFFEIFDISVKNSFENRLKFLRFYHIEIVFPDYTPRSQFCNFLKSPQNKPKKIEEEFLKVKDLSFEPIWAIDCFKLIIGRLNKNSDYGKQLDSYKTILLTLIPPSATVEVAFPCLDFVLKNFKAADGDELTTTSPSTSVVRSLLTMEVVILPGLHQWCDQFSTLLRKKEAILKLVQDEFRNQLIKTTSTTKAKK